MNFKLWLEHIPENAIKVHLPSISQQTKYSCGVACLRAICLYFGLKGTEQQFIKLLDATPKDGTWPENIIKVAKNLGFNVKSKTGMSIDELKSLLDKGIPVICSMQAWGNKKDYDTSKNGHYAIAVGYSDDKIYFQDPSIHEEKRGSLTYKDFIRRWHDIDIHGHDCKQLGIAIWKPMPKNPRKISKATEIE